MFSVIATIGALTCWRGIQEQVLDALPVIILLDILVAMLGIQLINNMDSNHTRILEDKPQIEFIDENMTYR